MTINIKTAADLEENFEKNNKIIEDINAIFSDLEKRSMSQRDLEQVDVVVDESERERLSTEQDIENSLNAMILDAESDNL